MKLIHSTLVQTIVSQLTLVSALLVGGSASTVPEPVEMHIGGHISLSASTEEDMFSGSAELLASAATDHPVRIRAALLKMKYELRGAQRILEHPVSDAAIDSYVHRLARVADWLDRASERTFEDLVIFATNLESLRLQLSDETTSLDLWLELNRSGAGATLIPSRFILAAEPVEPETPPDYAARSVARGLLT